MKYITFQKDDGLPVAGWVQGEYVVDMHEASKGELPSSLLEFITRDDLHPLIERISDSFSINMKGVYPLEQVKLVSPLPRPTSVRDFYAFEQHVKTARAKRGLEVIPEWYKIPVFYFSNHLAIKGPYESIQKPEKCQWLDYELEIACIIGKQGENITPEQAEDYIFGYCIMNDWSARDIQQEEMKVGLGPAKGKDFATSLGPTIVTKDELERFRIGIGNRYDLKMTAKVNDKLISEGNLKDIHYSFGQLIERASEDVMLFPGDVIGSGTVGTGCILEVGTEVHPWLKSGDRVELEITGLGKLINQIQ